jgi:hypothetical protein
MRLYAYGSGRNSHTLSEPLQSGKRSCHTSAQLMSSRLAATVRWPVAGSRLLPLAQSFRLRQRADTPDVFEANRFPRSLTTTR